MTEWIAFVIGVALALAVWTATGRAVLLPGSRSARRTTTTVHIARVLVSSTRALPSGVAGPLVRACAPAVLIATAVAGLVTATAGVALAAPLLTDTPARTDPPLATLLLQSDQTAPALTLVLVAGQVLLGVGYCVYLSRFVRAYDAREQALNRMLGRPGDPDDGEQALARHLADGSPEQLDRVAGAAARWLADVRLSHQAMPLLMFTRPRGHRTWLEGALIVLDAAALVEAVAPDRLPPNAATLLEEGEVCLPRLAHLLGLTVVAPPVALHGREEHDFTHAVDVAAAAGLPLQRTAAEAWESFQSRRRSYAPQIAAMLDLLCRRSPTTPPSARADAAGLPADDPRSPLRRRRQEA